MEPNIGCAVKSRDMLPTFAMRGNKMKKIASVSTNPKRNPIEKRFLMGTMLSTVVLGSVHATPLDPTFVLAQAPPPPQSEQEDKKQAPQRPGQRQKQQEERREAPKPPAGEQPPGRRQERQVQPPPSPGEQPPGRRQERQVQPPPTPVRPQERQVQPPPTPVRNRRDLHQAHSSRVSAAPAVPPGSLPVPSRHNSRSGRLRSLHLRYSHRPRQRDPPRRKRNAPSCRRRRRTVRDALTTCAVPDRRCARAIAS